MNPKRPRALRVTEAQIGEIRVVILVSTGSVTRMSSSRVRCPVFSSISRFFRGLIGSSSDYLVIGMIDFSRLVFLDAKE